MYIKCTFKARKWLLFPTPPVFDASARGNPLEFLDETYPAKTIDIGLPYGGCRNLNTEQFVTDPPARQTDWR